MLFFGFLLLSRMTENLNLRVLARFVQKYTVRVRL